MSNKTARIFSRPLFKQSVKANVLLLILVTLAMCLITTAMTYAISMRGVTSKKVDSETQKSFISYLYVLSTYNKAAGTDLSYDDFVKSTDKSQYDKAFGMYNAKAGGDFSSENFGAVIDTMTAASADMNAYVRYFEYYSALNGQSGVFTGKELSMEDCISTVFSMMGIDQKRVDRMTSIDIDALLNRMYFTMSGLLLPLLYVVITSNSLIAGQVDRGSMAYVLSTPTRRSAVSVTQAVYLALSVLIMTAVTCGVKVAASYAFLDKVNLKQIIALYIGMYALLLAISGICYFSSSFFNLTKKSFALGGGLTVFFFLCSVIGMFGIETFVQMGMGVKELDIFNKFTIISLFDTEAIGTVGTASPDYSFVWKLLILAGIGLAGYIAGAVKFNRKDLPL